MTALKLFENFSFEEDYREDLFGGYQGILRELYEDVRILELDIESVTTDSQGKIFEYEIESRKLKRQTEQAKKEYLKRLALFEVSKEKRDSSYATQRQTEELFIAERRQKKEATIGQLTKEIEELEQQEAEDAKNHQNNITALEAAIKSAEAHYADLLKEERSELCRKQELASSIKRTKDLAFEQKLEQDKRTAKEFARKRNRRALNG